MPKLGISIYPTYDSLRKDKEYLYKAASFGFKTVFTCLLNVEQGKEEETRAIFKEINSYARRLGMEVTFDVAPSVFDKYEISYDDLKFFYNLDAYAIRLDEGFDSHKEAVLSYNPYGLKIVINASIGTKYLDNIISFGGNRETIEACHNFYPQRYTGLSYEHFTKCNQDLVSQNIPVGAFISSQNQDTFGPWPLYEGLCTLEEHRNLSLDLQARHLAATKQISQIIVGNAYASDEELKQLSKIDFSKLTFAIDLLDATTELEKEIIFQYPHYVRGDMSEYMVRSTECRIAYQENNIPPHDTFDLKRGDVVIVNNLYGRYKGELHICLKDMPNEGNKNIVGRINQKEQILLEYLDSWIPFSFITKD